MESLNGHTARDKLAAYTLPTRKEDWPAYRAVKAAAASEQAAADAAAAEARRIAEIHKLAWHLVGLTHPRRARQAERIAETVDQLKGLTGRES